MTDWTDVTDRGPMGTNEQKNREFCSVLPFKKFKNNILVVTGQLVCLSYVDTFLKPFLFSHKCETSKTSYPVV